MPISYQHDAFCAQLNVDSSCVSLEHSRIGPLTPRGSAANAAPRLEGRRRESKVP
jgi:hypothetical protein